MHILIVNDDGISCDRIAVLAQAAKARGHRVSVFAPALQQSAKAHSFTIFEPLLVKETGFPNADAAYAVSGTPADCTRLGLMSGLIPKPDLVMSGINLGLNVGLATYVSGTVGAAREAAFQQIPAMAVSVSLRADPRILLPFADLCVRMAERLPELPRPELSVLNVNCPGCAPEQITGITWCPISRGVYKDCYTQTVSPRGDLYFWPTPASEKEEATPGSDLDYVRHSRVTCTMLTPDPTDQSAFSDWFTDMKLNIDKC